MEEYEEEEPGFINCEVVHSNYGMLRVDELLYLNGTLLTLLEDVPNKRGYEIESLLLMPPEDSEEEFCAYIVVTLYDVDEPLVLPVPSGEGVSVKLL